MEEKEEYELSQEEIDTIFTGKRPEGMDYNIYKAARAQIKKGTKHYLRGRMIHKSVWYEEIPVKDGEDKSPEFIRKTSTYYKPIKDE